MTGVNKQLMLSVLCGKNSAEKCFVEISAVLR